MTVIYIIFSPVGLAHAAKQDGELNGMLIPGGSLIMPNIWYGVSYQLSCMIKILMVKYISIGT